MRTLKLNPAMLAVHLCPGIASAWTSDQQRSTTSAESPSLSRAVDSGPVPVPEPSEKALAYYHSGIVLWVVNTILGLAIPLLFLFTGLSARIRNWARHLGRKWFFAIGIYFLFFSVISFLIDLPLSYYEGFLRQHAYDLSNQTLAKWLGDEIKTLVLGIGGGFLFLWVPY